MLRRAVWYNFIPTTLAITYYMHVDHGYFDLEKVWDYLLFECYCRQIRTDFVLPDDETLQVRRLGAAIVEHDIF